MTMKSHEEITDKICELELRKRNSHLAIVHDELERKVEVLEWVIGMKKDL